MAEFNPSDDFDEITDVNGWDEITLDEEDEADEKKYFLHRANSMVFNPLVVFPDILEDYEELKPHMTPLTEDNGVFKKILRHGDGNAVPVDSDVYILYNAFLEQNDEPYDSTDIKKDLHVVKLEDQKEFLGFQLAVKSMEYNEVAQFIFTPKYFYGPLGCPPKIPKDSSVMFFIEVLDSKNVQAEKKIYKMSFDELKKVLFKDVKEAVEKLKDTGNQKYKNGRYEEAILRYKVCCRTLVKYGCRSEDDDNAKEHLQLTLVGNLVQCYLAINDTARVIEICEEALKPNVPKLNNAKMHFRYAKALFTQKKFELSLKVVHDAMAIEPDNQALKALENKVRAALAKKEEQALQIHKKMAHSLLHPQDDNQK